MRLILAQNVERMTHISDRCAIGIIGDITTNTQIMGRNRLSALSLWKIEAENPGNAADQEQQRKKDVTPFKHLHPTTFQKSELILAGRERTVYGKNVYFRHGK